MSNIPVGLSDVTSLVLGSIASRPRGRGAQAADGSARDVGAAIEPEVSATAR
jgi:hypothetical protein